jgi:hypothetical protein
LIERFNIRTKDIFVMKNGGLKASNLGLVRILNSRNKIKKNRRDRDGYLRL